MYLQLRVAEMAINHMVIAYRCFGGPYRFKNGLVHLLSMTGRLDLRTLLQSTASHTHTHTCIYIYIYLATTSPIYRISISISFTQTSQIPRLARLACLPPQRPMHVVVPRAAPGAAEAAAGLRQRGAQGAAGRRQGQVPWGLQQLTLGRYPGEKP